MRRSTPLALAGGLLALAIAGLLSLMIGARTVAPGTVWGALTAYDPGLTDHAVIHSRLLRTLAGIAVGAALAVAGAAMQGVTRNPLADPGILGINAGATTAVVIGVFLLDASTVTEFMVLALLGAGAGTVVVYVVASLGRDSATPVKLALAGAAITAGLGSVINALVLLDSASLDRLRFWQVGTLGARSLSDIVPVAVLMVIGAAMIAAPPGCSTPSPSATMPQWGSGCRWPGPGSCWASRSSCCAGRRSRWRGPSASSAWWSRTPPGCSSAATTGASSRCACWAAPC